MLINSFESKKEEMRVIDVVSAEIRHLKYNNEPVFIELHVVPNICHAISHQAIENVQASYPHLIDLELADYTEGSSELEIDALIGGDYYWKFVTGEIKQTEYGPVQ